MFSFCIFRKIILENFDELFNNILKN